MSTVIAVVQARMGSSRLPGKAMRTLAGTPVLEHVLRRVLQAATMDRVVLTTGPGKSDDVLVKLGASLGVSVHRGAEEDVLARFAGVIDRFAPDVVVRVCADNPFVAPEEADRAVRAHLSNDAHYTFNHIPALGNRYPDGLGVEVVGAEVLRRVAEEAVEAHHREHVTSFIREHPERFRISTIDAPPEIASDHAKLDIDTESDHRRMEALANLAPCPPWQWSAPALMRAYTQCFRGD